MGIGPWRPRRASHAARDRVAACECTLGDATVIRWSTEVFVAGKAWVFGCVRKEISGFPEPKHPKFTTRNIQKPSFSHHFPIIFPSSRFDLPRNLRQFSARELAKMCYSLARLRFLAQSDWAQHDLQKIHVWLQLHMTYVIYIYGIFKCKNLIYIYK